jgi:hypothetical protein
VSHQVLAPRASRSIRANIKVSSTETGIIFGNIIYEQVCAVAAIHIGGSSTPPMPKPTVAPLVTSRIAHIRGPYGSRARERVLDYPACAKYIVVDRGAALLDANSIACAATVGAAP